MVKAGSWDESYNSAGAWYYRAPPAMRTRNAQQEYAPCVHPWLPPQRAGCLLTQEQTSSQEESESPVPSRLSEIRTGHREIACP